MNSIKHVVDVEGALSGGGVSANNVVVAVPNVDTTTFKPGDVRVGSKVNGLFVSIFIIGSGGQGLSGSLNWLIIKLHEGQTAPTPGQTGISKVRNQIFHEEKGLAGSADGTPMAFKGVIAVPRGMRRMREGDVIQIRLVNSDAVNDANFCIKTIYKSWF